MTGDLAQLRKRFGGMIAPAVTPFENDDIRWDLFRADIEYLLRQGVDGIGVAGSTGEGAVLSDLEIGRCIKEARAVAGAQVPIVAGIIRNSTREALSAVHSAAEAGADVLLVTPVFYFGGSPSDNHHYYEAIAQASSLPIIVYNVVPTNLIGPQTMLALSEIRQVIGVKQVGLELLSQMTSICGNKVLVYSACDTMLYSTYVAGSIGAISALITVAPGLCVKQWHAFLAGEQETASKLQKLLTPIAAAYAERPFPPKVKSLINLQGRRVGVSRRPLGRVSADLESDFAAILQTAGLS